MHGMDVMRLDVLLMVRMFDQLLPILGMCERLPQLAA
jgi:hypothetical protein